MEMAYNNDTDETLATLSLTLSKLRQAIQYLPLSRKLLPNVSLELFFQVLKVSAVNNDGFPSFIDFVVSTSLHHALQFLPDKSGNSISAFVRYHRRSI